MVVMSPEGSDEIMEIGAAPFEHAHQVYCLSFIVLPDVLRKLLNPKIDERPKKGTKNEGKKASDDNAAASPPEPPAAQERQKSRDR